jgi:3D (Asp-Asp-Asp) domain-containing protein
MAKEYMGKTAIVYTPDFELIGIYEVEDTGGDYRIKNGQCIDIYIPDYDSCIEFGRQDVIVYLMDAKG